MKAGRKLGFAETKERNSLAFLFIDSSFPGSRGKLLHATFFKQLFLRESPKDGDIEIEAVC